MPSILMIVSSAHEMTMRDGSSHPTGYWAEEVLKPHKRFAEAGVDVVIATPDGKRADPDPYGLEARFQFPDEDEDFLASVIRTFMPDVDDIRITLQHLTGLNLIAARRVFNELKAAGLTPEQARGIIDKAARQAWSRGQDFADAMAESDSTLSRDQVQAAADAVWAESTAESARVKASLAAIEGLNNPVALADLSDEAILEFDAVFFPGGHGPMVDLANNGDVRRALRLLHEKGATVAALCHGPAALLAAGERADGSWLFDGYKLTSFTDEEEDQTEAGQIGMPWYLETALKNSGAIFDDSPAAWTSHVVVDRNLVTAQNPNSSEAGADAVLKAMHVL